MKRSLLLFFLLISFTVSAQLTNTGKPASWDLLAKQSIPAIELPGIDLQKIKAADQKNDTVWTKPFRIGIPIKVDYSLQNSGSWTTLENGDRIWRILFSSEDAVHLSAVFKKFYLPRGATIYLYNPDHSELIGAYTDVENNGDRMLSTWFIKSDKLWIEYYEPKAVKGQGLLEIGTIVHGYRLGNLYQKGYLNTFEKSLNDSGDCQYDVNCPVGNDFDSKKDILKNSVAFLNMGDGYICSGALVNNTSQDKTPYFLTANHCYERASNEPAANPSIFSMRFKWISPNPVCAQTTNSTNGPTNFVMSGSTLRARNGDSDFMLLELNNNVPDSWGLTFSGWDHSETNPVFEVGIHHPSGDIMKISRDNDGAIKADAGGVLTWLIGGASDGIGTGGGWEIGATEGGSSGSPLFDQNGRIIGQLYGGLSGCNGTVDNGEYDVYGRFGISWDTGTTPDTRLKDWLDPEGTNQTLLNSSPPFVKNAYDIAVAIEAPQIDCGSYNFSPVIRIRNAGTQTVTSLTISLNIDGQNTISSPWTGTLNEDQEVAVTLSSVTSTPGTHNLNISVTNPNGQTDQNLDDNNASVPFAMAEEYTTSLVYLFLTLDENPGQTSWVLKDANDAVLYSGGPYTASDTNAPIEELFNVSDNECYTFQIFDTGNNGICCNNGEGSYKLLTDDNTVIKAADGTYGSGESTQMITKYAAEFKPEAVILTPNPATGIFRITGYKSGLEYTIYNMLGQALKEGVLEENLIDLSG
ncbi:MAG: hypothetical protein KDC56_09240, partial [Flavobacteriaceae bacterium]|nr:hypothetical protein [Flavobacteriaceae bacterium]